MDQKLEDMIAATPAPKVTPGEIEACIKGEFYFTGSQGVEGFYGGQGKMAWNRPGNEAPDYKDLLPLSLLTFCVLVLDNGFTVVGTAGVASPENFDFEIGKRVARQKAVERIWPLLGFRLRDRLVEQTQMKDPGK